MRSLLCFGLTILIASSTARGQAPDTLDFQGRITNLSGVPLDTTGLTVTFRLYKGGVIVWSETQAIDVADGVFNVHLGADTPLDTVAFDQPMELGIKIDKFPEMIPRTPLTSAAYALAARGHWAVPASGAAGTSVNVIQSAENNVIFPGVVGGTIGGGGGTPSQALGRSNTVDGNYGTIGGGRDNRVAYLPR